MTYNVFSGTLNPTESISSVECQDDTAWTRRYTVIEVEEMDARERVSRAMLARM